MDEGSNYTTLFSAMQTKLLIIINNDTFFLSHRKDVALAAQAAGYDVTIVTRNNGKHDKIRQLGLRVLDLKMNPTGMNPLQDLKTVWFLYRLYRNEHPDIVHLVGPKLNLWGTLAARMAGIRNVVSAVSGLGVIFNGKGIGRIMPYAFRFTNRVKNLRAIFQNEEDKATYLNYKIVRESQCRFIKGSGINLNDFAYSPEPVEGRIKIMFTARMIREKGIDVILEAAHLLYSDYKDRILFELCGGLTDVHRSNYVSPDVLNSFGDSDYFSWLGMRDDVHDLLVDSHIFIFPSYYGEGLPKSCIEANAIGRPIITTDSVGCKDTVIDGYNGYIIPIRDAQALADKLRILIEDKTLRQQMGRNARKYAEDNFSIEDVIKRHLDIYAEFKSL